MNDFLFLHSKKEQEKANLTSLRYSVVSTSVPCVVTLSAARTAQINDAFLHLKDSVIQRGICYVNNTAASKGGYMAENFVAESYNLDSVLKQIDASPAIVPAENELASPDILYDDGKGASLKFYKDVEASTKAQLNPKYKDQVRVIPKDQFENDNAKNVVKDIAEHNMRKGRVDVANEQLKVAEKLSDRIRSDSGVESTPLTKKQNLEMADAITKDKNGNIVVDNEKFDHVLDETGVTKRVKNEIVKNELRGFGLATAIACGLGFTLNFISEIAQRGIELDAISDITFNSITVGAESGLVVGATYIAGRTATSLLVRQAGINLATKFGSVLNASAIGVLSTAIICMYQYVKLRVSGEDAKNSVGAVGKTALSSLSVLTVSMIAQGIWGGPAGLIVSTSAGILYLSANIFQSIHSRGVELRLREYSIEEYKALIDDKNLIYIS